MAQRALTPAQELMIEDGLPAETILDPVERKEAWKGRKLTKPRDLKAPTKDEDPATRALRKEIAAADAKKKAERLARLKELKPKPAKQENDMKKAAKKTPPKAARKAAGKPAPKKAPKARAAAKAAPAAPDGRPVNAVVQQIAAMMSRPEGASMAEMVAATGVEAHPMRAKIKQVRDKLGLATEAPSKENGGRYFVRAKAA